MSSKNIKKCPTTLERVKMQWMWGVWGVWWQPKPGFWIPNSLMQKSWNNFDFSKYTFSVEVFQPPPSRTTTPSTFTTTADGIPYHWSKMLGQKTKTSHHGDSNDPLIFEVETVNWDSVRLKILQLPDDFNSTVVQCCIAKPKNTSSILSHWRFGCWKLSLLDLLWYLYFQLCVLQKTWKLTHCKIICVGGNHKIMVPMKIIPQRMCTFLH